MSLAAPIRRLKAAVEEHPLWALAALGAACFALQALGFHDLRHDDAFITYRYGQNLAGGRGMVFNPGERVMASTSPGQALLAALLYPILGRDGLPAAMALLGCAAWTAQAAAVFFLLRRALGAIPALLCALCLAAGCAGSGQWVALETNLAVALTLWALVCATRSRYFAAALLCAAAGLVRPDAYLVALLLLVAGARDLGRRVWRPAALFLALSIPWPLFAAAYFGSPLPTSALVKFHQTGLFDYAAHIGSYASHQLAHALPLALSWIAFGFGAYQLWQRDRSLWILPAYGLLHFAAYLTLRPATYYTWHLYPGVAVFTVVALAGLASLRFLGKSRIVFTGVPIALAAMIAVYGARSASLAATQRDRYWFGARDAAYRGVARWLRAHAEPGDRVVALEVGTLAYYTDLAMHDLSGLVTRDRARLPTDTRWLVWVGHEALRVRGEPAVAFKAGRFRARVYPLPPAARRALERRIGGESPAAGDAVVPSPRGTEGQAGENAP